MLYIICVVQLDQIIRKESPTARNVVGPPVRDDDLFGRDDFINLLWDKLHSTNVLLAAPRRFGKTSVMYHLLDHPREGCKIIHSHHIYNQEVGQVDIDDFNRLLGDLENDFYIRYDPATDSYCFATNILKDWWKRYYAL